jgi:glycine/D-amino acid oxidase-like deaminating enzyme
MPSSVDVAVVGAGLFGSIIAAALRRAKASVLTIDPYLPEAGSPPAACLMKPSWFSSLGKSVYEPSLRLLDELYGTQSVRFQVGRLFTEVVWCPPNKILQPADKHYRVRRIQRAGSYWELDVGEQLPLLKVRRVVVAAGVWTPTLVSVEGGVTGLAGVAYLWPSKTIERPFVKVWAPYRQLVAFNRGDGVWVGDGTSIKRFNWTAEREVNCYDRCQRAVGYEDRGVKRLFGMRPYVNQKPCYLKEHHPGFWVATGGAKNGTLAAGWCASEIVNAWG